MIIIPRLKCLRCGHKWPPRSDKLPKVCPLCKSLIWNKPGARKTKRREETRVGIERCNHPYYKLADGKLLCVVCGAPSGA